LDHKLFERGRGNVCSVEVYIYSTVRIIETLTDSVILVQLSVPVARNYVAGRRAMGRAADAADCPIPGQDSG
jgi:hypothetical protein